MCSVLMCAGALDGGHFDVSRRSGSPHTKGHVCVGILDGSISKTMSSNPPGVRRFGRVFGTHRGRCDRWNFDCKKTEF